MEELNFDIKKYKKEDVEKVLNDINFNKDLKKYILEDETNWKYFFGDEFEELKKQFPDIGDYTNDLHLYVMISSD